MNNPVFSSWAGGLYSNAEASNLELDESSDTTNMISGKKQPLVLRKGQVKVMDASSTSPSKAITFLTNYTKSDGTNQVLVGFDGLVKILNITDGTLTDLPTPISGRSTTAKDGIGIYDDVLYFSNGVNSMVKYDGTTNSTITLTNLLSATFNTNSFIFKSRKMFAIDYGNPRLLHRSKTDGGAATDIHTFNYSGGAVTENSGTTSIKEGGTPIRGVRELDSLYIYTENRVMTADFKDIAGDTVFDTDTIARGVGAVSQDGIVEIGNAMVFFDPKDKNLQQLGQEERYPSVRVNGVTNAIKNLTQSVYGFDKIDTVYWKNKVLIACKSTVDQPANDLVLMVDLETNAIYRINGWFVNKWCVVGDNLYYGSSIGPFVFQAFESNGDDSGEIEGYWKTKVIDFNEPATYKNAHHLYIEGTIDTLQKLAVTVLLDRGRDSITKVIDGSNTEYVQDNTFMGALGEKELGVSSLGGVANEGERIFYVVLKLNAKKFINAQIQFKTVGGLGGCSIKKCYFTDPEIDTIKFPSNRII